MPHALDDLVEAGVAAHVGSQHQAVDEKADQAFDLGPRAVGDRRADDDVGLAGMARQHGFERRQQQLEQRGPLHTGEDGERVGQAGIDCHIEEGAAKGGHRRARPVGHQRERRQLLQLAAPVCEQRLDALRAQLPALPGGVVGVLQRRFGQG